MAGQPNFGRKLRSSFQWPYLCRLNSCSSWTKVARSGVFQIDSPQLHEWFRKCLQSHLFRNSFCIVAKYRAGTHSCQSWCQDSKEFWMAHLVLRRKFSSRYFWSGRSRFSLWYWHSWRSYTDHHLQASWSTVCQKCSLFVSTFPSSKGLWTLTHERR